MMILQNGVRVGLGSLHDTIPGDHYMMMQQSHVRAIAQELEA